MKDTGYRGIWTYIGSSLTDEPHRYVHYSGGLGTGFQQILPLAVYAPAANRTFFCYGGTRPEQNRLLIMASWYCHASGTVPRPTIVLDKGTDDTHDNPSIMLDSAGHVWVFASAHGTARPAYVFRSREPYSVEAFELVWETNFSYAQPWFVRDRGFLLLHTRYVNGRRFLYWMTSPDGKQWADPQRLAAVARGHYQISWRWRGRVGTAFNYHPEHPRPGDDVGRTNLYYLETDDMGQSWRRADGTVVTTPLVDPGNAARVHDFEAERLLVYLKDLNYDANGRPVILFLTSRGGAAGPRNEPRVWTTARWTGDQWEFRPVTTSDNNFDTGCLHIDGDGTWRIIGPTEPGPQPYNVGGEVAVWTSHDQGTTWCRTRRVTSGSPYNHSYVRRPVDAHPEFQAFWADGHGREVSQSRLYFCDATGERVFRLPTEMAGDTARPGPQSTVLKGNQVTRWDGPE